MDGKAKVLFVGSGFAVVNQESGIHVWVPNIIRETIQISEPTNQAALDLVAKGLRRFGPTQVRDVQPEYAHAYRDMSVRTLKSLIQPALETAQLDPETQNWKFTPPTIEDVSVTWTFEEWAFGPVRVEWNKIVTVFLHEKNIDRYCWPLPGYKDPKNVRSRVPPDLRDEWDGLESVRRRSKSSETMGDNDWKLRKQLQDAGLWRD